MPIDDRLRASLQWDRATAPLAESEVLNVIVARAARRRRIRIAGVGMAATALLVAVTAPWAISRSDVGGQPVKQPTPGIPSAPKLPAASPIDARWEGSDGSSAERLAALDQTGLQRYGQAIYAKYLAHTTTDLQFAQGDVTLATSDLGGRRFLGAHPYQASLHGTFAVRDHSVVMRFEEAPGTTVFRWSREDDRVGERLELTFISTTAGSLYGAPAEVFFRMWSARPFWILGG